MRSGGLADRPAEPWLELADARAHAPLRKYRVCVGQLQTAADEVPNRHVTHVQANAVASDSMIAQRDDAA